MSTVAELQLFTVKSSVCEVRKEPVKSSIINAKDMFKTFEKNGTVYCIKGS